MESNRQRSPEKLNEKYQSIEMELDAIVDGIKTVTREREGEPLHRDLEDLYVSYINKFERDYLPEYLGANPNASLVNISRYGIYVSYLRAMLVPRLPIYNWREKAGEIRDNNHLDDLLGDDTDKQENNG